MPYINDEVYDQGLDWLTANATRLDICSQEPTTYTEAISTYSLGDAAVSVGAATNGDVDGRKVVVPAVSAADVDVTASAADWGLTDGTSVLAGTGDLSASQAVTSGNTFDLAAFNITIRDPA